MKCCPSKPNWISTRPTCPSSDAGTMHSIRFAVTFATGPVTSIGASGHPKPGRHRKRQRANSRCLGFLDMATRTRTGMGTATATGSCVSASRGHITRAHAVHGHSAQGRARAVTVRPCIGSCVHAPVMACISIGMQGRRTKRPCVHASAVACMHQYWHASA